MMMHKIKQQAFFLILGISGALQRPRSRWPRRAAAGSGPGGRQASGRRTSLLKHVSRRVFQISRHDLFPHDDHYRLHGISKRVRTIGCHAKFRHNLAKKKDLRGVPEICRNGNKSTFQQNIGNSFSCHHLWIGNTIQFHIYSLFRHLARTRPANFTISYI